MYLLCERSSLNMCEHNRRLYGKFLLLSLFIYLCGIQNALIILFRSLTPSLSFKKNMMSSSCFGLDRSFSINYIGKFIARWHTRKKYLNKVQASLTLKPFPKVTQNVCFLFSSYLSSRCHLVWTDRFLVPYTKQKKLPLLPFNLNKVSFCK